MTTVLANQNHWTFSRQDLIPQKPDSLWHLERGVVRTLTWSVDGTLRALGYWGPGDVVGQPLSRLNPYQIECSTCVEASIVPKHLWHQVVDAMVRHVQQTEELLSIIHRDPIYLRLQQFLIWLAQKFGRDFDQGQLIDLQLTHQEIAEAVGTTRVTVTRLLNQLKHEGIIRYPQRRTIVLCSQL